MTLQERAAQILADYRRHADDLGICNNYYCGQSCSYIDELDERVGELLAELAGAPLKCPHGDHQQCAPACKCPLL